MNTTKTKTTKGRQKIEIKKIEKVENRQVTFTKRRGGLFKKAGELCILTAADVAVIVKSPGGRTFAFGHPNVDEVIDRYLSGGKGSSDLAVTEDLTRGFSCRYDDLAKELEEEKRRKEMIAESNVPNIGFWWQEPMERVRVEELESYVAALEELMKKVNKRADEMMFMRASNSTLPMLAMNNTSSENSSELAYHFINQPLDSSSINYVVPFGYDFGHGHA